MSYGSTDIYSTEIRPIETGRSEPPSRTGTPTLNSFSISSPSDIRTPTSSELRTTPFYPQHFNKDKISVLSKNIPECNPYIHQIVYSGQQLHHSLRVVAQQHHKEQINLRQQTLQHTTNQFDRFLTTTQENSFATIVIYTRKKDYHQAIPVEQDQHQNPNPPTRSRINEHTYLFALDHKTWNCHYTDLQTSEIHRQIGQGIG